MDIPTEVYPVVRRALEFYRRLQQDGRLSLDYVQSDLRGRLKAPDGQVTAEAEAVFITVDFTRLMAGRREREGESGEGEY